MAALLVLLAVVAIAQAQRASRTAIPLDPAVPNEGVLLGRGLRGTPATGQLTGSIAVDRVVTD